MFARKFKILSISLLAGFMSTTSVFADTKIINDSSHIASTHTQAFHPRETLMRNYNARRNLSHSRFRVQKRHYKHDGRPTHFYHSGFYHGAHEDTRY